MDLYTDAAKWNDQRKKSPFGWKLELGYMLTYWLSTTVVSFQRAEYLQVHKTELLLFRTCTRSPSFAWNSCLYLLPFWKSFSGKAGDLAHFYLEISVCVCVPIWISLTYILTFARPITRLRKVNLTSCF